jgi:CIC family chloride channel protein
VPSAPESPAHRGTIFASVLRGLRVRDVAVDRPVHVLKQSTPMHEVLESFMHSSQSCFPVVDGEGRMTGTITLDQVRLYLDEYGEKMPVIAHDMASQAPGVLLPDDALDAAMQRMVDLDIAELPIVDGKDRQRVIGLLSRRDIVAAYNRQRAEGALAT